MQCIFGHNWAHMGLKYLCDLESDLDLDLGVTFQGQKVENVCDPSKRSWKSPECKKDNLKVVTLTNRSRSSLKVLKRHL